MQAPPDMPPGLLSNWGIYVVGGYLVALLGIGVAGRLTRREDSMSDFYLGGRNLGLVVLFFTLYATQYSGNTMIGYTAGAYRNGYQFLVSVTFMMSVIGAYLLYAPTLYRLSQEQSFVTPGDFLSYRYGHDGLTAATTVIFIVTLGNFLLTQLLAIGAIAETSTGGTVSPTMAMIALAVIILIYQTLGGLRSVAWTDVLQGVLLLGGVIVIFIAVQTHYGGIAAVGETLRETRPDFWAPPTWADKLQWASTIIIIFFGISIYPQAIQRIYAARSERILKRSLQWMVFMPLATTLLMILAGIVGATRFPGLSRDDSENITLYLLNDVATTAPGLSFVLVLFIAALLAAIMSTADSALLSISSMFTQDFYRSWVPSASQHHLTTVGKAFSWMIMAAVVAVAVINESTIWALVQLKIELLIQCAPAIFLGILWPSLRGGPVLAGLLVGTLVTGGLMFSSHCTPLDWSRPLHLHDGLWGFGANLLTLLILQAIPPRDPRDSSGAKTYWHRA